jgi:tetrahydromethanopterin S-methyltransferase subunit D
MNRKKTSLTGALVTILVSCCLGGMLMIGAGMVIGNFWYYIAAVIFFLAGGIGFVVVRKLDAKINGPR